MRENKLKQFIGKHIIHHLKLPKEFKDSKWIFEKEDRDVILMAIFNKWAMVGRFKCVPYVCRVEELSVN